MTACRRREPAGIFLTYHDPSGRANAITVSILKRDKLARPHAREIRPRRSRTPFSCVMRKQPALHMCVAIFTALKNNGDVIQLADVASQRAQADKPNGRASDIVQKRKEDRAEVIHQP